MGHDSCSRCSRRASFQVSRQRGRPTMSGAVGWKIYLFGSVAADFQLKSTKALKGEQK